MARHSSSSNKLVEQEAMCFVVQKTLEHPDDSSAVWRTAAAMDIVHKPYGIQHKDKVASSECSLLICLLILEHIPGADIDTPKYMTAVA